MKSKQGDKIEFRKLPGNYAAANPSFLKMCSELYSNHYGKLGLNGFSPGEDIRLSPGRIREWLDNDNVIIYYATLDERLIGYAIALNKKDKKPGIVTWATQLVVDKEYRNIGIAKRILFSIWGFKIIMPGGL